MAKPRPCRNLGEIAASLERLHGTPPPPPSRDPWEPILLENVAYLVDDARRDAAYRGLAEMVGTSPARILAAPRAAIEKAIARGGMLPPMRAEKLFLAARIAAEVGVGKLRALVQSDPVAARKQLLRFPGFGEPSVEKVLLFAGTGASLAPDSNALRVLVRLGLAADRGDYAKTYRAAETAVARGLPERSEDRVALRGLLREHGKRICTRTRPDCDRCPLRDGCDFFRSGGSADGPVVAPARSRSRDGVSPRPPGDRRASRPRPPGKPPARRGGSSRRGR